MDGTMKAIITLISILVLSTAGLVIESGSFIPQYEVVSGNISDLTWAQCTYLRVGEMVQLVVGFYMRADATDITIAFHELPYHPVLHNAVAGASYVGALYKPIGMAVEAPNAVLFPSKADVLVFSISQAPSTSVSEQVAGFTISYLVKA